MASTLLFLLSSLLSIGRALPNVTAIQIDAGTCQAFPNSFHGAGDNADAFVFHPDQADNLALNGLTTGIYGTNLVAYPNSATDPPTPTIFCCDRGGTILDGFGVQSLLLPTNRTNDEELGYLESGSKPETYTLEVNGTALDGVYLGKGNVTTWGFRKGSGDMKDLWLVRLLAPSPTMRRRGEDGGVVLYDGEVKGFLKVVGWVAP
ncbi:uncharacterized protein LY89DRAFT_690164 [Mollisia scopiformis]|uniref:Uncharacterized protein n=1 Tax=Mollisia scopiformis TaxID=149040 RepID=A0A132BBF2_MOLSC|nr:uncharacterized protein LY89DRAFT_690164 [Mollisia scopiformis]KUJ09750.1 hypothetical protein LY89DRAFT_690164 [Mollisia scopiformis]